MIRPEKDLADYLYELGETEYADIVVSSRMNAILIERKESDSVPVGNSKIGGYPDLPPEISYPIMSGFSEGDDHYAESAMQLAAQINLADIAAYDKDDLLPHTGMLYFFWSGEIIDIKQRDSLIPVQKVIYYNGDVSTLKRTPPSIPYYTKYFTEVFEESAITFSCGTDYECLGNVLDCDQYDEISELAPNYDLDDLCYSDDKIFGHPYGANAQPLRDNDLLLLQFDYREGCLWSLYWAISNDALKRRDFEKVKFSFDMD